MAETIRSGAQ